MCSLYAIFAIGAANSDEIDSQSEAVSRIPEDDNAATDYIEFAKRVIPVVYDEADIDSIRGLAIMVRIQSGLPFTS